MLAQPQRSEPQLETAEGTCPNCLAPAPSRFCPECGQRQGPLHLTARALLHEAADELFNLESKLPRTLKLLFRPGFLTCEYLAGRRERYVRPFRLFVVLSCALFLLLGMVPLRPPPAAAQKGGPDPLVMMLSKYRGFFGDHLERFSAGGASAEAERVRAAFADAGPKANVLSLPLFALLVGALFRKARRTFADHFVFGLHYHAFYFLVQILTGLVGWFLPASWSPLSIVVTLGIWTYLGVALRRAYDERWPWTVLKEIALVVCYGLVQFVLSMGIVVIAVLRA